jgi:hypothetical protein
VSHEFRFEGVFEASPEEVFDAFTESEVLSEVYEREDPAGPSSGREIWIDRALRARARSSPEPE